MCNTVLYIFPADSQVQHRAFSDYVANHIDLYDEQLVKAISRMAMSLSAEETKWFLRWTTEIEMQKIHPASGDAQAYSTIKENSETIVSGLSCFIWRLFGHKDKGIRCKASHALLRATLLGNEDMTKNISELYKKSLPKWYMDGGNYYFIESAKLWYLASCLRITIMNPEHLLPLYLFFKGIACAKGTIHALHRRIAKNICLHLAPVCEPESIEQLASCDKCILTNSVTSRLRHLHKNVGDSDIDNLKFHFDTMDTLPYWYNHLANIFDCTRADVANECDYFVAEFGITNEKCVAWSEKFLLQEDYRKTYNDHGTIPTVETLKKYAEWHSMFYVADRLRQTESLTAESCEDYESWLNEYLPGVGGFWGFEFRNHVPLIPFLWNFELTTSAEPEQRHVIPEGLEKSLVDNVLGISLDIEFSAHIQHCNRRISMCSALVEKGRVEQLVEEMKKPYTSFCDFYNLEDEYTYREHAQFFICPTCDELISFPGYSYDKKDLLLKDCASYLMSASDDICKYLGVTHEELLLHSRIDSSSGFPVSTYHWSEPEAESGYEKHSTNGRMVIINDKCLFELLKNSNQAIAFEVTIAFEDDSYKFYGTPRKPARSRKILVLEMNEQGNVPRWKEYTI